MILGVYIPPGDDPEDLLQCVRRTTVELSPDQLLRALTGAPRGIAAGMLRPTNIAIGWPPGTMHDGVRLAGPEAAARPRP